MYYKKEGYEWQSYDTLTELLEETCKKHEDLSIFSWKKGRKFIEKTYRDWGEGLRTTAAKLSKLNGSHIGVISDLSYESLMAMYAVIVAGKIVVPLEADQTKAFYEKCIDKADIDLILLQKDQMEEKPEQCNYMTFSQLMDMEGEIDLPWPKWEADRPACIFFTSGTTGEGGKQSCVLLSQKNVAAPNAVFHGPANPKHKSETLLYLPVYHVLAFTGLVSCMAGGYKIYLGKGAKYLQVELLEYHPEFIISVPLVNELLKKGIEKGIQRTGKEEDVKKGIKLAKLLLKFGLDFRPQIFKEIYQGLGGNLRVMTVGGAFICSEVVDFFDDLGIFILTGYGMTETAGMVSHSTFFRRNKDAAGIVLPYNEVKIVDGEILVRGDNVMLGYYKDEEATSKVMEDGWLKTGDLGYLDKDGYLYITGRKKNLIILSNGVNVSPEELEYELMKSPVIEEVVVREKDGHIHAEIYAGECEKVQLEKRKGEIQEVVNAYNYSHSVYNRIASWELRDTPFDKTVTMKIKRY